MISPWKYPWWISGPCLAGRDGSLSRRCVFSHFSPIFFPWPRKVQDLHFLTTIAHHCGQGGREFTRFCRRLRRRLKKPLRPLVDWNTLYQEARVGAKPGLGGNGPNVCFEVQRSIQAAQAGKGEGLSRFQIQKIDLDKVDLHSAPRIPCIWSWCKIFPTIGLGGNLPRPPKLLVSQLQRDTTQPLILILHIP